MVPPHVLAFLSGSGDQLYYSSQQVMFTTSAVAFWILPQLPINNSDTPALTFVESARLALMPFVSSLGSSPTSSPRELENAFRRLLCT